MHLCFLTLCARCVRGQGEYHRGTWGNALVALRLVVAASCMAECTTNDADVYRNWAGPCSKNVCIINNVQTDCKVLLKRMPVSLWVCGL
jgi:hypothetical protein